MSEMPEQALWSSCKYCGRHVHTEQWGLFLRCPFCGFPKRLTVEQRIDMTFDSDSFQKIDLNIKSKDQLHFEKYDDKLTKAQQKTKHDEAITIGSAKIGNHLVATGIMDNQFMVGTLNTTVGEGIRQIMEVALEQRLPLVLFVTSGGARMQEGIFSLLQMNTILAVQERLLDAGILNINILTDPTMGGASASFAFNSDYVLAEDHAQIGFSGKRVIEQTSGEQLPDEFQSAEYLLEHGQLDDVIQREKFKDTLQQLLDLHTAGDQNGK